MKNILRWKYPQDTKKTKHGVMQMTFENQIMVLCRSLSVLEYSCASNELYKRFSPRRSDLKYYDSFYSESLMKGE